MLWAGHRAPRLTSLVAWLILLLGGAAAHAEDPLAASPPRINGRGGLIAPPPTGRSVASDETPETGRVVPSFEHRSILLDLSQLRPPPSFDDDALVNEIAPEADSPGSLSYTYEGLYSIVVRRAVGYYRRLFSDQLKARWDESNDSIFTIQNRLELMGAAEADLQSGGRWWERTWRQSLTPQSGGAPPHRVLQIGKELEIFRLGEVALTNEGKLKVGNLSLYLDDDRIYERIEQRTREALFTAGRARADANLSRVVSTDKERAERPVRALGDEAKVDVSVGLLEDDAALDLERVLAGTTRARTRRGGQFQTPRGNVLTGDGWNMSFRPNVSLKLPDGGAGVFSAISRAEAVVDLRLYPGETRQLFGILTFRASTSGRDGFGFTGQVQLEIVRW